MNSKMYNRWALFLTLGLMIANLTTNEYFDSVSEKSAVNEPILPNSGQYGTVAHDVITIDSDSLFDAAHGVVNGTGTLEDPYIIEGWAIDGGGTDYCIKLDHTEKYVEIRNCTFTNSTKGIYLYHAENIIVTSNLFHDTKGNNGTDATASSYATSGQSLYGIYSLYANNVEITHNIFRNYTGGNGGNGFDNSTQYRGGYTGGSVRGIYWDGKVSEHTVIEYNYFENFRGGNGGHGGTGETGGSPSAGGTGASSGSVTAIHVIYRIESISHNIIKDLKSGDGGDGGIAGYILAGVGLNGGKGGDVGLTQGIKASNINEYLISNPPEDILTSITNNSISNLKGGKGGNGGGGGMTYDDSPGGIGGAGGNGLYTFPISIAFSDCMLISDNIIHDITHGLHGLGGYGGVGSTQGSGGTDGNPGSVSGLYLVSVTDGVITGNSILDLKHPKHDETGIERGLYLSKCYNLEVVGNDFEGEQSYCFMSEQITLNTMLYGNYWGLYKGAVDMNPRDGIMDVSCVLESDNFTDFMPLAYPISSDPDKDSINMLDEILLGLNPVAADTDFDSIPDNDEISLNLDPLNPQDAAMDFDNDGLTNLQEYRLGTNIGIPDTDGDLWGDGVEIQLMTDPLNGSDHPPGIGPVNSTGEIDSMSFEDFAKDYGTLAGLGVLSLAMVAMGFLRKK